jgi:hypothetical protein
MQELIQQLTEAGVSREQAANVIDVLSEWLDTCYPVAGVLVSAWIRNEMASRSKRAETSE